MRNPAVAGRVTRRGKYEKPGTVIYFEESIEAKSFAIPATVVRMPFFDPPRKKAIIGAAK